MEFKRLGDVTLVEEAMDIANVLIEEDGEIKRVPKTEVGGTGFPTAIIKDSMYDDAISGVQQGRVSAELTYECLNMTFEEAYEIMASGGILNVIGMLTMNFAMNIYGMTMFPGIVMNGVPCIVIGFSDYVSEFSLDLFWTADGLSTEAPSSGK